MWLLDKDENIKKKLTLISAIHTEVLNGENALTFECLEKVEKMDRVLYQDSFHRWHEFIIQEVVETKNSNEVYAENSIFELHGDFIEDKRPEGTPLRHLNGILEKTRWSVGTIDGFPAKKASYYRISVYEALSKICDVFNAYRTYEIKVSDNKIVERVINIKSNSGEDNGKRFTYSKDLIDVERTILLGDVLTALYGFGRGEEIGDGFGRRINFGDLSKPDSPLGAMYVEDKNALKKYGRNSPNGKVHVFGKWEFDDIDDKELLYIATKEKLQELNKPKINYKANVMLLNDKHENVKVGDAVSIIDTDFRGEELRLKGIVFKIEHDILTPENSVIELGNYIKTSADADKELHDFVSTVRSKANVWDRSNAFDENGQLKATEIADLLEVWNAKLNSSGGYVYAEPGKGIITYDAPIDESPTSAIQITGAGFRIANSKKSNGDWDWKTIGNGDGIYGEYIMAGSITTNQFASEVGAALDISSNDSINLLTQKDKELENELTHQTGRLDVAYDKIESNITETIKVKDRIIDAETQLNTHSTKLTQTSKELNAISGTVDSQGQLLAKAQIQLDGVQGNVTINANSIKNKIDKGKAAQDINSGTVAINANRINLNGHVTANGNVEFTTDGMIIAKGGRIGGWIIQEERLQMNQNTPNGMVLAPHIGIWMGGDYDNAPFRVTRGGDLKATNATITGHITATSGSFNGKITALEGNIGNWRIVDGVLDNGSSPKGRMYLSPSGNYWKIMVNDTDGNTIFGVQDNGSVFAMSGNIGDFKLGNGELGYGRGTNAEMVLKPNSGIWLGGAWDTAPFYVSRSGNLRATNAQINGDITADSGRIGGFTITSSGLMNNSSWDAPYHFRLSLADSTYRMWSNDKNGNKAFSVTYDGRLFANNADIKGNINASSGKIGDWTIGAKELWGGSSGNYVGLIADPNHNGAIYAGGNDWGTSKFSVYKNGKLYASNAEITGKVTATSGTFTGGVYAGYGNIGNYSISNGSLVGNNVRLHSNSIVINGTSLQGFDGGGITTSKFHAIELQATLLTASRLTVTGDKNAIVPTRNGIRGIHAYETAVAHFGDIGECFVEKVQTIEIDPLFGDTIHLEDYHVFLSAYSNAKVWVENRTETSFEIHTDKPTQVSWEIKGVRRGYKNKRMPLQDMTFKEYGRAVGDLCDENECGINEDERWQLEIAKKSYESHSPDKSKYKLKEKRIPNKALANRKHIRKR